MEKSPNCSSISLACEKAVLLRLETKAEEELLMVEKIEKEKPLSSAEEGGLG